MNRYIAPIILLILSGAIYAFYIEKNYQDIRTQFAKEKELSGYLVDAANAQQKLDELAREYQNFPPDADEKLNILLPDSIDHVRFLFDVDAVAKKNGLEMKGGVVEIIKKNDTNNLPYSKAQISFGTTATYPIFRTFLRDLERSLALRDFNNISFKSAEVTDEVVNTKDTFKPDFSVYDYQIQLTSYSLQ